MSRMFVAVVPPEEVVEDLDDFLSVRRSAGEFRWTLADQWHVTLAFAAHVPDRAFDELCDRLAAAAGKHAAYRPDVVGGGAFPHPDAGARAVRGPRRVVRRALAGRAQRGARRRAWPSTGQRFHPHLTLARLGRPANVTRWVRLLDAYARAAVGRSPSSRWSSRTSARDRGSGRATRCAPRSRSPPVEQRSLTFVAGKLGAGKACGMSLEIGTDADPHHWHEQTDAANGNRLNALRAGRPRRQRRHRLHRRHRDGRRGRDQRPHGPADRRRRRDSSRAR